MYELCKEFRFESAHTIERDINNESSSRIHGHSYRAQVSFTGVPDKKTGMIIDSESLDKIFKEIIHTLDHRMLNEIDGLAAPTMENLAFYIWSNLETKITGLKRVTVFRDSLSESCSYSGNS